MNVDGQEVDELYDTLDNFFFLHCDRIIAKIRRLIGFGQGLMHFIMRTA